MYKLAETKYPCIEGFVARRLSFRFGLNRSASKQDSGRSKSRLEVSRLDPKKVSSISDEVSRSVVAISFEGQVRAWDDGGSKDGKTASSSDGLSPFVFARTASSSRIGQSNRSARSNSSCRHFQLEVTGKGRDLDLGRLCGVHLWQHLEPLELS